MRSWLPTSSPSPPQFNVEVAQTHLRRLLEPLTTLDGQAKLTVSDDAIVVTSVDDPVVTAVEASLHQNLCHEYEAAPGTIEFDPVALRDILATVRDDDELVQFSYAPEESTLRLALPSVVHTQTVSADVTVERPDIDGSPDSAMTYHARDGLSHALEYFVDHSPVVVFGYDESGDECYLEGVSTSETIPETKTRYRCAREQRARSSTPESVRSAFSTAKLRAIVETVPSDTVIRAEYAEAFPIRLAWDLTGGCGIVEETLTEVTVLLAPREDSDTPTKELEQTSRVDRVKNALF